MDSFLEINKWVYLLECECVNHVIWTVLQILKLASNVYLLFCVRLDQKEGQNTHNLHNDITQPFLNFEGAPKCVSQHTKKTSTKIFDI